MLYSVSTMLHTTDLAQNKIIFYDKIPFNKSKLRLKIWHYSDRVLHPLCKIKRIFHSIDFNSIIMNDLRLKILTLYITEQLILVCIT